MKNNFRLSVFMLFFCLFFSGLNAEQGALFSDWNATISMDLQDANLKDVLKILSIQSGLNFFASEALNDRKITLYLDKVPIRDIMDKLFKANNLNYDLDEDSNIIIVKDSVVPKVETITKVFYLKYATVSSSSIKEEMSNYISSATTAGGTSTSSTGSTTGESGKWTSEGDVGITKAVKKILSEYGSVIEDYRTNSIIVTDIPTNFSKIEQVITRLDVSIPSVFIEVEMLDVSKNLVDKMGFDFSNNPLTLYFPGAGPKFFFGSTAHLHQEGTLTIGHRYAEVLNFLKTQTDTKYLARPRLLTLNNETAEIKITTQESVGVITTTTGTTGTTSAEPERAETGISLRVTPQVNLDSGEITMFIYPQVSEATAGSTLTSADKTYTFRDPEVRSTKSVVKIKDGETVIVGGLIRNEFSQTITKLPILGDIPILGSLFRHKNKTKDKERELLVFITPHIVKDTDVWATYSKNAALPKKGQNRVPLLDRQAVINKSLNSFEKIK